MWKNDYTSLKIEGKRFHKEELLAEAQLQANRTTIPLWKKSFWNFIIEWLNDNDIIIVQTSGSTGIPKLISIPKEKMVNSAKATGAFFQLDENQKALLCLPCDYIAGKMMVVRAFVQKLDLILSSPQQPLKSIVDVLGFVAMVPLQIEKAIKETPRQVNLIQKLIIGGAPISNTLLEQLKSLETQCFATYGMTETITHIAIKSLSAEENHYCTLPNVKLSLDERSCLVIDAPKVADEKVITNDIVEILSENSFKWLGRVDNIINSGGVKLHPELIEKKLSTFIKNQFFISSIPHDTLGEQVVLVIEKEDNDVSMLKIDSVLNKFEKPKKILFVPKFVETETGKIKRKETLKLVDIS